MRFVLILLVFGLIGCQEKEHVTSPLQITSLQITSVSGQTHSFDVEVALTPKEQARGLMFRESMGDDEGMLFYFGGDEAERGFWMKNTLIPLDIIFIKADGVIHHIHENAIPHDLTSIRSKGPAAAVLEINGGLASKIGIQKGDKVKHTVFQLK